LEPASNALERRATPWLRKSIRPAMKP